MKVIILQLLKTLGSELLLRLVEEIAELLKNRDDNTMHHDADRIKAIVRANKVK